MIEFILGALFGVGGVNTDTASSRQELLNLIAYMNEGIAKFERELKDSV